MYVNKTHKIVSQLLSVINAILFVPPATLFILIDVLVAVGLFNDKTMDRKSRRDGLSEQAVCLNKCFGLSLSNTSARL